MAARTRRSTTGPNPGKAAHPTKGQPRRNVREERQALYRRIASEAAERIFAANGSGQASMQEVAAEAGLSLATIYGVVDGKDGLLFEVHAWRMREFLGRIREARDSTDNTLEAHLAVLLDGADFFLDHPDFLRLCCRDGYGWASGLAPTANSREVWTDGISIPTDLFARGVDEGVYVDEPPALLARKMLALKQVELTDWVEGGMHASAEEIHERLEAQFLRAFCTPIGLRAAAKLKSRAKGGKPTRTAQRRA